MSTMPLWCLQETGEISNEESALMTQAYDFFRVLINALRLRRGNALDVTLPQENTWELEHLARRVGYTSEEITAGRQLIADFDSHCTQVYEFVKKHLGDTAVPSKNTSPASLVFASSSDESMSILKIFKNPEQAFTTVKVWRTAKHFY